MGKDEVWRSGAFRQLKSALLLELFFAGERPKRGDTSKHSGQTI